MICCTFAGHRNVPFAALTPEVRNAIESILQFGDKEFTFYSGGKGTFDGMCEMAVRSAKRAHPELSIRLKLVLPYMTNRLNTEKDFYKSMYDDVIIPIELCDVYPKAAISKRNCWMVDKSDYVIAFLQYDYGGAYDTVRYASKNGKNIIMLHTP